MLVCLVVELLRTLRQPVRVVVALYRLEPFFQNAIQHAMTNRNRYAVLVFWEMEMLVVEPRIWDTIPKRVHVAIIKSCRD